MRAFYSDTFVLPLPEGHRFPMTKYRRLRERLVDEAVLGPADLAIAEPASWEDIGLVHDPEYVLQVAEGVLPPDAQRRIGFPWSPGMVERSRRSVGATIAAAREVGCGQRPYDGGAHAPASDAALRRDGRLAANLAGGTHHAYPDHGAGYCVFNDVAIAATVLLRDKAVRRVTVVDCDVHQGDGTASIFRDDSRVFTMSLHGATNFPFRKETSDLDVTFDDGAGDEVYLAALGTHLPRVLDQTAPDLVFYLAGADPYEGDRLGRLALSIDGLRCRDRLVFHECRVRGLPVVIVMAGGYALDVETIVEIHVNTIKEAVRSENACR
jgi:acetoin utilization deacetylase AcuC-like enzyme